MVDNPLDDEIKEKMDDIHERVKEARRDLTEQDTKRYGEEAKESPEVRLGKQAASMFLGNVLAGVIFGFVIDYYFGTIPWGFMFFTIMGFVAGVFRAQAVTKKDE